MLTVEHLTAGYDGVPVLRDLCCGFAQEFCVVLGQNGSGKTTLFRAVSGTLRPMGGQVLFDGEELPRLPARQRARRVAQVLTTHQTLSGLTGMDIARMAFYAVDGLFYRPCEKQEQRIRQLAKKLDAASLPDRLLEEMSAGERQLAELLAALCQDTPLLLLDEPTASLDFNRTHELLIKAKRLAEHKTVIATLHDPALALRYADRIYLLQDGRLVAEFAPASTDVRQIEAYLRMLYPRIRVIRWEGGLSVDYQTEQEKRTEK